MKLRTSLTLGASLLAGAAMVSAASAATPDGKTIYPYKINAAIPANPFHPVGHVGPHQAPYVAPKNASSGTWTDVGNLPFKHGPWGEMLMTDGTVLILDYCTTPAQWYKLTPDASGNYTDGTWSTIATMPAGYAPLFFSQQVLPATGDVIINGGEYNASGNSCGGGVWTNKGALYNYTSNTWQSVTAPSGWNSIGDSESIILPDGDYLLADCCFFGTGEQVIGTITSTKKSTTVSWAKPTDTWSCNGGACMDEEGFTSLPNGDVFLVDVWNHGSHSDEYWIYDTSTAAWSEEGNTPDYLSSTSTYELGPAPLTPQYGSQGTILQYSANPSSGVNDIYNVATNTWTSGPVMKVGSTIYDVADGPSAVLPDGNVLVQASPGTFESPSGFWEWNISSSGTVTATQVNSPTTADDTSSFEGNLLILPTGQAMWDNSQVSPNEVAVYTPQGSPQSNWLPVISSVETKLKNNGKKAYAISGTNFNGWDLGGYYGDDAQQATNWPIIRITNNQSGDVCYGRSYNFSTMGVWTTGTTNADFTVPKTCEKGASSLQVVVNGIASAGVSVTVK
ncbi:MAG TPA: hypothetical protein VMF67_02990 [Rhizomicrobium sp.]|nr:hypothetical protein [Rhizomicrobium sp.]